MIDVQPATKWRHVVAMGVSPWNRNPDREYSPEGTIGIPTQPNHVAPSGLFNCVATRIHGFAPVATACRPFRTDVLTPGRYVGAEQDNGDPATKWRNDAAVGVSLWSRNPNRKNSPEGTTGIATQPNHVAPSGLRDRSGTPIHGFAPVATACRPFGTDVLTPGRYLGAEEVEDDGVPFPEKMEGLTRELATQFHVAYADTKRLLA